MRVLVAATIVALLSGPAFAQSDHVQRYGEKDKDKTPAQIEADKAAERAYRTSLGNIPDKSPTDPWGAIRTTDAPKTAPTAAKPKKTKTGSANN